MVGLRDGTPEEAGLSARRLDHARDLAAEWVADGMHPAISVLVARRGVIALHEAFGKLGAAGQPLASEQLDLDDATLDAADPPPCPPPERGLRACLWRRPGARPAAAMGLDAAARAHLRALGYVQ